MYIICVAITTYTATVHLAPEGGREGERETIGRREGEREAIGRREGGAFA